MRAYKHLRAAIDKKDYLSSISIEISNIEEPFHGILVAFSRVFRMCGPWRYCRIVLCRAIAVCYSAPAGLN